MLGEDALTLVVTRIRASMKMSGGSRATTFYPTRGVKWCTCEEDGEDLGPNACSWMSSRESPRLSERASSAARGRPLPLPHIDGTQAAKRRQAVVTRSEDATRQDAKRHQEMVTRSVGAKRQMNQPAIGLALRGAKVPQPHHHPNNAKQQDAGDDRRQEAQREARQNFKSKRQLKLPNQVLRAKTKTVRVADGMMRMMRMIRKEIGI